MSNLQTSDPIESAETKIPVSLRVVAETSLTALAARVQSSKSNRPIINDASTLMVADGLLPKHICHQWTVLVSPFRTVHFDKWVTEFLSGHDSATVPHLGCGFDTRAQRVAWNTNTVWIDIDLPEAVAGREKAMATSVDCRSYALLAADVTTGTWINNLSRTRQTVIVMEGVLSYLTKDEAQKLLERLVNTSPEGEILFDCINSVKLSVGDRARIEAVRKTGASFQSAIDDLAGLRKIGSRVHSMDFVRFVEAPGIINLPILSRVRMWILSWIPGLRDSVRFSGHSLEIRWIMNMRREHEG